MWCRNSNKVFLECFFINVGGEFGVSKYLSLINKFCIEMCFDVVVLVIGKYFE